MNREFLAQLEVCKGDLIALCRGLVRDKNDLEDAVQDSIVQALGAYPRFTPGTNFKGWLLQVATAPEGFTATEVKTQSANTGSGVQQTQWTNTRRTYSRADGLKVDMSITSSPQLIASARQMVTLYKNPQILAMANRNKSMKVSLVNQDGWTGLKQVVFGRNATITAFSGHTAISLKVNRGEEAVLAKFWSAINLAGLARATSGGAPAPAPKP